MSKLFSPFFGRLVSQVPRFGPVVPGPVVRWSGLRRRFGLFWSSGSLVGPRSGGPVVWWSGGLVVWWSGGLVVWWSGG